jgi:hypothetical protein
MAAVSPMPISESVGEAVVMDVHEVFMVFRHCEQARHTLDAAQTHASNGRGSASALQRIEKVVGIGPRGCAAGSGLLPRAVLSRQENLRPHDAPRGADHERQSLLVSCWPPSGG